MSVTLEKIYELAIYAPYHLQLLAGEGGIRNLVDWVHVVEEPDYIDFLKGRELIITTGIKEPDEAQLLKFTEEVYQAKASGLIINVGRYITQIPASVLQFGNTHDFPVFTLPWKVHLVDFNRELCNLIYRSERERDDLDAAIQKAIFSRELSEQYLPVLKEEGIFEDTRIGMIHCYLTGQSGEITQFFYRFQRQCQQLLSSRGWKYSIFRRELYVTVLVFDVDGPGLREIVEKISSAYARLEEHGQCYLAVADENTRVANLSEKYRSLSILCRKNRKENCPVSWEADSGVWRLLLGIEDREKLREYSDRVLERLDWLEQETGSEYRKILESYLEENGNIQEAAARCYLHRNTVTYQLKKISEITGKNLNDARDRNELYLAFQIRKILEL